MTDPIRAALERLVELDARYAAQGADVDMTEWDNAIAAARAALSAPTRAEGVGELALELGEMAEAAADDGRFGDAHFLSRAASVMFQASAHQPAPPAEEEVTDDEIRDQFHHYSFEDFGQRLMTFQEFHAAARAAIALDRSRRAPAPPAEGEVGELVARLRDFRTMPLLEERTRAADLLAQRHPAPVPVSERLPGPEDCDAEGRCWCFDPATEPVVRYGLPSWEFSEWDGCWHTHWLPAHALPLQSSTSPNKAND